MKTLNKQAWPNSVKVDVIGRNQHFFHAKIFWEKAQRMNSFLSGLGAERCKNKRHFFLLFLGSVSGADATVLEETTMSLGGAVLSSLEKVGKATSSEHKVTQLANAR